MFFVRDSLNINCNLRKCIVAVWRQLKSPWEKMRQCNGISCFMKTLVFRTDCVFILNQVDTRHYKNFISSYVSLVHYCASLPFQKQTYLLAETQKSTRAYPELLKQKSYVVASINLVTHFESRFQWMRITKVSNHFV